MRWKRDIPNLIIAFSIGALSAVTFHRLDGEVSAMHLVPLCLASFLFYDALTSRKPATWFHISGFAVSAIWLFLHSLIRDQMYESPGLTEIAVFVLVGFIMLGYKPGLWGLRSRKGLREISWIKPLSIAICWTVLTWWYPAWSLGIAVSNDLPGFVERLMFILPLAIASDFVDVEEEPDLKTLPIMLGPSMARYLIVILFGVHVICAWVSELSPWVIAPDAIAAILIWRASPGHTFRKVVAVESIPILHALFALL